MTSRAVLILGGTAEARELAAALVAVQVPVISSLAGRVSRPRLPVGEVRVGGFGGPEGLADWLRAHSVRAVIDATHPFAERISASAVFAARAAGIPLARLERPGWAESPGDRWHRVGSLAEAARVLPGLGSRIFLTTGRQGLPVFAGLTEPWFLIRCVDPPEPPLPPRHELLLSRGPYTEESELELLRKHRIEVLATKDSGGPMTAGKLAAARRLGLPVVLVSRPRPAGAPVLAHSVTEVLAWLVRTE